MRVRDKVVFNRGDVKAKPSPVENAFKERKKKEPERRKRNTKDFNARSSRIVDASKPSEVNHRPSAADVFRGFLRYSVFEVR